MTEDRKIFPVWQRRSSAPSESLPKRERNKMGFIIFKQLDMEQSDLRSLIENSMKFSGYAPKCLSLYILARYREYRANRDKKKRHIFSSENAKFDLKIDPGRSFKPILHH